MSDERLTVTVRRPSPTVAVIDIQGEVGAGAESALSAAYEEAGDGEVQAVLLNFADLEYMNSSGIGLLVTLLIRANRNRQRLCAVGLNDHYREIFALTRIDEAITVFDTEADAIAAL